MAEPALSIVRASAYQSLVRRLDAAVALDVRLTEARDAVLRPVQLLSAMARDAPGSLADDVLVADRLRALLFLCWPYASLTLEARALLDSSTSADGDGALEPISHLFGSVSAGGLSATAWPLEQPAEPGVIDHGALLIILLAAARVADSPFAPVFLATVHGVALSASAAEVLGRLDPRQPDSESMRIVLEMLYLLDAARAATKSEVLRPFAFDPVERGRWRCLEQLFHAGALAKAAVAMGSSWDGATSHEISKLAPRDANAGDKVTLTVARAEFGDSPLSGVEVVFAGPGAALVAGSATVLPAPSVPGTTNPTFEIEVTVPAGARPGWVGFSRPARIAQSNARRAELRAALAEQLNEPCMRADGSGDLAQFVPDYGARATPRRRANNRFEGGEPALVFAGVTPSAVPPGAPSELAWETAGCDYVRVTTAEAVLLERGPASGRLSIVAPASDGEDVRLTVAPFAVRDGKVRRGAEGTVTLTVQASFEIAKVVVTQGGSVPALEDRELHVVVHLTSARTLADGALVVDGAQRNPILPTQTEPGLVAFTVPAAQVRDGIAFTVTVADRLGESASRVLGPYSLRGARAIEVVLARPAIVGLDGARVEAADAARAIESAAAAVGLSAHVIDLPFCDDDLAVLLDTPSSDEDPSLLRVLEALARRAVLTPRFEHALWLALLPSDREQSALARSLPAYAARAVSVATSAGLPRLLRASFLDAASNSRFERPRAELPSGLLAPHLAIIGTLSTDPDSDLIDDVTIEEVRLDERRTGPGAPLDIGIALVSVAADGRELNRQAVRVLSELSPIRLSLLVPIAQDVAAVELRRGDRVLKAFRRAKGSLSIEVLSPPADGPRTELDWQWQHTHNARPRVSLLLKRGELSTPAHTIDPCHTHAELPLWRFVGDAELVLHATDGWNSASRPIFDQALSNDVAAVVRELSDGRFFADVPAGWDVIWRLNGATLPADARTLSLAADDSGVLELEARSLDTVLRDRREVPRGVHS